MSSARIDRYKEVETSPQRNGLSRFAPDLCTRVADLPDQSRPRTFVAAERDPPDVVGAIGDTWSVMNEAARVRVLAASDGCYDAMRTSVLSGVPQSTVYWWARHGVVTPSVSPTREKLWSYADLMALRIVSWLRHKKPDELPASPMPRVRQALALLADLDLDLWNPGPGDACPLLVDARGLIFVRSGSVVFNESGQAALLPAEVLKLTAPFTDAGLPGPDLVRPRPHLRIVPSKLSGEPHLEHSRITTLTVAALAGRGYVSDRIASMYDEPVGTIAEALDLEQQLSGAQPAAA